MADASPHEPSREGAGLGTASHSGRAPGVSACPQSSRHRGAETGCAATLCQVLPTYMPNPYAHAKPIRMIHSAPLAWVAILRSPAVANHSRVGVWAALFQQLQQTCTWLVKCGETRVACKLWPDACMCGVGRRSTLRFSSSSGSNLGCHPNCSSMRDNKKDLLALLRGHPTGLDWTHAHELFCSGPVLQLPFLSLSVPGKLHGLGSVHAVAGIWQPFVCKARGAEMCLYCIPLLRYKYKSWGLWVAFTIIPEQMMPSSQLSFHAIGKKGLGHATQDIS